MADAQVYLQLTSSILGGGALVPQRLRFGASGLLNDIEAVLSDKASGPATSTY